MPSGEQSETSQGRTAEFRGARAASNSMFEAVGKVVVIAISLITTPITFNKLGWTEFTIWTLAISVIGYVSVVDPGFYDIVSRYGAIARARGETLVAARICALGSLVWLAIGALFAPLVFGLVPVIVDYLHLNPGVAHIADDFFYWSFGLVVFNSILSTASGRLNAIGDQWMITVIDVSSRAIYAVVLVVLLLHGWRLSAIVAATTTQFVLAYAATLITIAVRDGRPYASPRGLDPEIRAQVFKFGGWLQLSSLLEYLTYETDPLVLLFFVNSLSVGLWGVSQRIARQTTSFATIPMDNVLPAMSASYGSGEGMETFRRIFVRSNSIVVLIGAISAGLIVAFGPLLTRAWLGRAIPMATTATSLVAITFLAGVPRQVTAKAIMAMGRVGYGARAQILAFVVNIVLTFALVYSFGLNGVLFATVVAKVCATGYLLIRFARLVESTMSDLVWPWLAPLIGVTTITTILGRLVLDQWPGAYHTRITALLALSVLGVGYSVVYALGLRLTRFFSVEDLRWIRSIAPGKLGVAISPRLVRLLTGVHA